MNKSIMLSVVFASASAFASTTNIVRMTPLATFVAGTNAVLVAANRYTDEHGGGGGGGGVSTSAVNYIIRRYDETNLTARIDAKRDKSDLAVYGQTWNFAPFEAVNGGFTYSIYSHGGTNYVLATSKRYVYFFNVCTLVNCVSQTYGIGYAVNEILDAGYSSCAGVEIYKNAIGPTSDTLAKKSEANVASVNGATGAVVLDAYDIPAMKSVPEYGTVGEAFEQFGQEISSRPTFAEATNIVTNVVTKSYIEGLGVSGGNVTNVYGVLGNTLFDGDRKVYAKLPFSAWTNNTAGAGGEIPAGLQFMPQADRLDVDFVWKATKGSDTYLLVEDKQGGGMSVFRLLKNGETPFPQAALYVSSDSTVLDFRTFKLYKYGSGDVVINTDTLALGSFASNINTKVETRTTRTYISQVLGDGTIGRSGLLGLYNGDSYYVNWPFSFGYWSVVVYPNVKSWVGSNYVPQTRKINGQELSTDITINPMDYQAMTNTVNAVKAQFYDEPLQVNWTLKMVNGEMKLYATTNVNMSVL